MDWNLFWAAVTGITSALAMSGGVVVFVIRGQYTQLREQIENVSKDSRIYTEATVAKAIADHRQCIIDAVQENVKGAMDAKIATLALDITTRINGTYMRYPEALARFADIQRQIDNL